MYKKVFSLFLLTLLFVTKTIAAPEVPQITDAYEVPKLMRTNTLNEDTNITKYMAGKIAVTVYFVQTTGGEYTKDEVIQITSQVNEALNWWSQRLPNAHISYVLKTVIANVSTNPADSQNLGVNWVSEITNSDQPFAAVELRNEDWRKTNNAHWAFSIFLYNGKLSNNRIRNADGFAYLNGPYLIVKSDAPNVAAVVAHETGHIFNALDQYANTNTFCDTVSGVYLAPTENSDSGTEDGKPCKYNQPSIMKNHWLGWSQPLDTTAAQQVGYRDSDCDAIIDVIDTEENICYHTYLPLVINIRKVIVG